MSLSWPEPMWRNRLRVLVGSDRLMLSSYRRGLLPTLMREECIPVTAAAGEEAWRAAMAALPAALAPSLTDRPDVTVVLSNEFVRPLLLPANAALRTPQEWTALARHRLTAVHGEAVQDWLVRVAETTPGGPRIACAMDRGLLDAIDEHLAGSGAHLASVQPYLMTAYNQLQSLIGNESCWLVIEEAGCLTLSLLQQGQWQAIRRRWVDPDWCDELPDILARKAAMLALDQPCQRAIVCSRRPAGDSGTRWPPGAASPFQISLQSLDYDSLALSLSPPHHH